MNHHFSCATGTFDLQPRHATPKQPIQAWSKADELLITATQARFPATARLLIVNDSHGALSVALQAWQPARWCDSVSAELAWRANAERNKQVTDAITQWHSTEVPTGPLDGIILMLPKTRSLLAYQLSRLKPLLPTGTPVIAATMTKHESPAMQALLAELIGEVERQPAVGKARLLIAHSDGKAVSLQPEQTEYAIPGTPLALRNDANVFARDKLDIGTRLLLEQLTREQALTDQVQIIMEPGCGNGALGCFAAHLRPRAEIIFTDDSHLALECARANVAHNQLSNACHFIAADGLPASQLKQFQGRVDTILCNPPFHAGTRIDMRVGQRLLQATPNLLNPNGELWVVANRHLPYYGFLRRYYCNVKTVASDRKFNVIRASAPKR